MAVKTASLSIQKSTDKTALLPIQKSEGECLSILRGAKEVSIRRRMPINSKVTKKKLSFMSFDVSMIKPLVSSKILD